LYGCLSKGKFNGKVAFYIGNRSDNDFFERVNKLNSITTCELLYHNSPNAKPGYVTITNFSADRLIILIKRSVNLFEMSCKIILNRQTDKASKIKSIPNEIQISPSDDTIVSES